MDTSSKIKELFDKSDKVKPMAEKDGQVYVTFDEAATLNSMNMLNKKKTGMQVRNRDGSIASTGKTVHAINPDYFFANRYKKKNKTTFMVVSGHEDTGYRCIKEQSSGHIHVKTVPCYVFVRTEEGELKIDKLINVSDTEFISDFTNTLKDEEFAKLLPMITAYGNEITADAIPI